MGRRNNNSGNKNSNKRRSDKTPPRNTGTGKGRNTGTGKDRNTGTGKDRNTGTGKGRNTGTGKGRNTGTGKGRNTGTGKDRNSNPPQEPATEDPKKVSGENVGKVYRGKTKYIDKETKPERNYVVVMDDGKKVSVAKLKSIKIFDENGKNADRALVEINATRYGLTQRTGVDFQRFDTNRMSGKPLDIKDKDVFPEQKERFTLSTRDRDKALFHTGVRKRGPKKKR